MTQEEKLDLLELYIEDLIHRTFLVKALGGNTNNELIITYDEKIDYVKKKILEEIKF